MSTTTKTPRLLAAAKEFNIGKDTLVEFLASKGFDIPSNPNAKITEVMYDALQEEFAQDKLTKRKSEEIALPKGPMLEGIGKTKEELDLTIKDKQEAAEAAPTPESARDPEPEPHPREAEGPGEVSREKPEDKLPEEGRTGTPSPKASSKEEGAPKARESIQTSPSESEEENGNGVQAPKLEGPHILGKIDLDSLGPDGKSKKPASARKKTRSAEAESIKEKAEAKAADKGPEKEDSQEANPQEPSADKTEEKKEAKESPNVQAPA